MIKDQPFSHRTAWDIRANTLSLALTSLKQKGVAVCDLSGSNPTLAGFQYLNESILQAQQDKKNLHYKPDPHGLLTARQTVVDYYAEKGAVLEPSQIFLTASTSEAYSFVFRLLFDPGDTILAPRPSYPLLDDLAKLHDIKIRRFSLTLEDSWTYEIESSPHLLPPPAMRGEERRGVSETKALLLVHPNNPTGNYVKAKERVQLQEYARSRGMALIVDEVFLDYSLGENIPSFAEEDQVLTFTVSGLSKVLGLPQMKLAWLVVSGPENLKQQAIKRLEIIADTFLSVSTPAQNALAEWMKQKGAIQKEILERVRRNYRRLKEKIQRGSPILLPPFEGGWSLPLRLPRTLNDEAWALLLLEKDQVLVQPGYFYDFEEESWIVVSLLTPTERFEEGLDRLVRRIQQFTEAGAP